MICEKRKAVLFVLIFSCLAIGVSTPLYASVLLFDDFESYAIGSWPSLWVKDANAHDSSNNRIVADPAGGDNQSLKMYGVVGGSWAAIAYNPVEFPSTFSVQARMYNGSENLSGAHPFRGTIGMRQGTHWTNPAREFLRFNGDETVTGLNGLLPGTYQTNRWYDVRIDYNRNNSSLDMNYWIDGNFVDSRHTTITNLNQELSLDHLELTAQEGSAYFDDIRVRAVSPPSEPDPGTFTGPLPPSDASGVVFMVHGWKDSSALFTTDDESDLGNTNMAANIENALAGKDWDVRTYDWSEDAALTIEEEQDPWGRMRPTVRAMGVAQAHGQDLARQIMIQYETDSDVHLVAHSLGGRVIDEAARVLETAGWNGEVHLTFLDAFTPGRWKDFFGEDATWAEHYYHREGIGDDYFGETADDIKSAHNVDITALLDDPGTNSENHKWPVRWYDSTIGQDDGYGFPTSMTENLANGLWMSPIVYPSSDSILAVSNIQSVNPVDQTISTSLTGTVHSEYLESGHVTLGTGSPVWINLDLTTDDVTNFLEFDFEFTEDADGLLSVYLDDELLGLFYERFALDGQQNSGKLFFEDDLEAGFHVLAFRVDPLTDTTSFVTLSGIEAGYMTVVPEPSTFAMLAMGALGLLVVARRRRSREH